MMLVGGESVSMEGKSAQFKLCMYSGIIDRQHTASSRQHTASLRLPLFEAILKIRSWCT